MPDANLENVVTLRFWKSAVSGGPYSSLGHASIEFDDFYLGLVPSQLPWHEYAYTLSKELRRGQKSSKTRL